MMKKTHFFLVAILACTVYSTAVADDRPSSPQPLGGRHSLFFNGGLLLNTNTFAGVSTNFVVGVSSGFVGSIGYGYWFADDWSLNLSVGLFSAEASLSYTGPLPMIVRDPTQGVSSSMIVPILFGLRYYPSFLTLGSVGRPFIGGSAGSYTQFRTGVASTSVDVGSQTVLGAQLTGGVDLFIAEWLRFGPSVSYHAIGDFNISGTRQNYSGAEFSLNVGFVF